MRLINKYYIMSDSKQIGILTFTDAQFEELKKLLQDYLKISAIAAVKDINEDEIERNARLLSAAGLSTREIGIILHCSHNKVAEILAGKWRKSGKKGKEPK